MWPFSKRERVNTDPLITNKPKPGREPPTFITYRNDRRIPGAQAPQVFGRYAVSERVDYAPAPVPYTQWWSVGRDIEHAWPHQWLYQSLNPADWLGVMDWPFTTVGHTESGSLVYMPRGQFIPQVGRSNIQPLPQTSLGAQAAVQAGLTVGRNHLKLLR
jgi:hypothetical protein